MTLAAPYIIVSTFCTMSEAPRVAMNTVVGLRPRNRSIRATFSTRPASIPAAAPISAAATTFW